ncbi:MAG: 7-carboxy-7-deazaguanine synthase QueE [bacterium]
MDASAEIMEVFSSIQGEGLLVGERQLFVRFYGCNRYCQYCDTEASKGPVRDCLIEKTPGHRDFAARPNPVSAEELIGIIRDANKFRRLHHSVALTGGEPLLHAGFLSAVLPVIASEMPVLLETNGILFRELEGLLPWVETISMDVKLASATGESTDWASHGLFMEKAKTRKLYIKAVLTSRVTDEEIHLLTDLIEKTGPAIPLVLQPVHGTLADPKWTRRLLDIQGLCKERLRTVRIIPQVHKMLNML